MPSKQAILHVEIFHHLIEMISRVELFIHPTRLVSKCHSFYVRNAWLVHVHRVAHSVQIRIKITLPHPKTYC